MIISTDNSLAGTLHAVKSVLREVVQTQLGASLDQDDFDTIAAFDADLANILKKDSL